MLQTIEQKGLAPYIAGFYERFRRAIIQNTQISTPGLSEFVQRGFSTSCVMAPSRMIDSVEEMLQKYRTVNTVSGQAYTTAKLPIMFVCVAKDWDSISPEWGREITEPMAVNIPGDTHNRYFTVQVSRKEIRVQVVFVAAEKHTASAMAECFTNLWLKAYGNHHFYVPWAFQGISVGDWPVLVDSSASKPLGVVIDGVDNLSVIELDFVLRASVPVFDGPEPGEPNDGSGANPPGFPVVTGVETAITPVH